MKRLILSLTVGTALALIVNGGAIAASDIILVSKEAIATAQDHVHSAKIALLASKTKFIAAQSAYKTALATVKANTVTAENLKTVLAVAEQDCTGTCIGSNLPLAIALKSAQGAYNNAIATLEKAKTVLQSTQNTLNLAKAAYKKDKTLVKNNEQILHRVQQ